LQNGGKVGGAAATVFIAGDNEAANSAVEAVVRKSGMIPLQTGGLKLARYIEPLAGLNIALGYMKGLGTGIAPTWAFGAAKAA
jgi:predicted dinucleotide-binding enzyme